MKPNKFFIQYTQQKQNHSHSPSPCIKTNKLCKKMQRAEINFNLGSVSINQSSRRSLIFKIPGGNGDGEVDIEEGEGGGGGGGELSSPKSIFQPFKFNSSTTQTPPPPPPPLKKNFMYYEQRHQPTSAFDSSLALTILVLLTALFFMGFFSLYLRRFADEDNTSTSTSRRRNRRPASVPAASSVYDDQKGKGLDPCTVRSLPMVCYGEDVKQVIFSDCPICLAEFEHKEIVKIIPHCRHVFHPNCIDTWLSSHVSCPFCRSTKFCKEVDGGEIRLDVKRVQDNNGVGESNDRSTVEDDDTSREVGLRRICSWTRLGDRVVLQRSLSF